MPPLAMAHGRTIKVERKDETASQQYPPTDQTRSHQHHGVAALRPPILVQIDSP